MASAEIEFRCFVGGLAWDTEGPSPISPFLAPAWNPLPGSAPFPPIGSGISHLSHCSTRPPSSRPSTRSLPDAFMNGKELELVAVVVAAARDLNAYMVLVAVAVAAADRVTVVVAAARDLNAYMVLVAAAVAAADRVTVVVAERLKAAGGDELRGFVGDLGFCFTLRRFSYLLVCF